MSVYKFNEKKGWYFSLYYNGKQYKREKYKGKKLETKQQAIQAEYQFKQELERELARKNGKMSLYELFDAYVNYTKSNLKESTKESSYAKFKRNYLTLIDDIMLDDLSIEIIADWRNKLLALNLSAAYKNRQINTLKNALNFGSIAFSLPAELTIPLLEKTKENNVISTDDKKEKYIPPEQFKKILSLLETGSYYYVLLETLYFTGLRIGELAALTVDDKKMDILNIDKDYVRVAGKDYIQAPKNKNSIRKVKLDSTTSYNLDEYIIDNKITGVIFKQESAYLNQQRLRRVLTLLSKKAGLYDKYDITPHTLRHSHASYLMSLGYNEYQISQRLGNTPQIASNTYIHAEQSTQDEIVKKLR